MLDLNQNHGRFTLNNLEFPVENESPREAIRRWLSIQPRMTTEQIAKLDNQPRRGGKTDPFIPKKNSKKAYPAFQVRTARLLRDMAKDKEIHRDRDHNNQPYLWMLPGIKFPQNFYTQRHEIDVADLFVSYYHHVTHWDTEWGEMERETLKIPHYRVNYDARMVLNGRVYLWEVDRGSEDLEALTNKVKKYVAFADSLAGEAFQVVFTLQKYRRMHFGNRADAVIDLLASQKRRNMFMVAKHSDVLTDPLGAVFVSPVEPTAKRLLSELT
jgi:hypothetical protein